MTSWRLTIAVSESRPVSDSQSASSGASRLPNTAIRCLQPVAADQLDDRAVRAVVAADEVRQRRAVRVAARQRDEVVRPDAAAGLLAQPADRARSWSRGPSGRSALARPAVNIGWIATPAM